MSAPGRTESFYNGVGGTGPVASSLNAQSAQFNDKVGRVMLSPHSVLQPLTPSPNGKSAVDAQRTLPGGYTLAPRIGIGDDSYEAATRLKMISSGVNEI